MFSDRERKYCAEVEAIRTELTEETIRLRDRIADYCRASGAAIVSIAARVKSPASLREKLIIKRYPEPKKRVTDLLGLRIITLFPDAIEAIVDELSAKFEILQKETVDKRVKLGVDQFGYRSYHLICRLKPSDRGDLGFPTIGSRKFEIQVRSILEHAWAEIEHDIRYKSGFELAETARRFAQLAAGLELFDEEFIRLRNSLDADVKAKLGRLGAEDCSSEKLDVGWLRAVFQLRFPQADEHVQPLDRLCLNVINRLGFESVADLQRLLQNDIVEKTADVAAAEGIGEPEVSHRARLRLLLSEIDAEAELII